MDNDDEIGSLQRMARDKIRQNQAAEAVNNPVGQGIPFFNLQGDLRGAPVNRNRVPGGSLPGAFNAGAANAGPAYWNRIPIASDAGVGDGGSVTTWVVWQFFDVPIVVL